MTNMTSNQEPQSKRALLADDDHALRMLVGQIIHSFGFEVTHAENGKRALELYVQAQGRFDLLITDICMPGMNGCDLIHEIRRRDQKLPIIAVTGYAEPELTHELESCHIRLFEKPINFEALHIYIDSLPNMNNL